MKFEDWWELNHDPHTKGLDSELVSIVKRFSKVAWEEAQPKWQTIESVPKEDGVKVTYTIIYSDYFL